MPILNRDGAVAVCGASTFQNRVSFVDYFSYVDAVDCDEPAVTKVYAWGREIFACEKHRSRLNQEIKETK